MAFAIVAFLIAFLLIGSGGLLIFYRDNIQERISSALYPRANKKTISNTLEETRHVIGGVVEQFEKILPRSQAETGVVQQRLVRAGLRSDTAVKIFLCGQGHDANLSLIAGVGYRGDSSQSFLRSDPRSRNRVPAYRISGWEERLQTARQR